MKESGLHNNSLPCSVEDILAVMKVDGGGIAGSHSSVDENNSSDTSSLASTPPSPDTPPHTSLTGESIGPVYTLFCEADNFC